MKTLTQKDIFTSTFTGALFITDKTWKQPKKSINGGMDKEVIYTSYTMEYYLVIKNKEILPFLTTWMDT